MSDYSCQEHGRDYELGCIACELASDFEKKEQRIAELEAIIRDVLYGKPFDEFGNRDASGLYGYPDHEYILMRLEEALQSASCPHGKSLTDYCEPCGRIHGGG